MKAYQVQVLTLVEGEEQELPQGYKIFRTNFDRGICTVLLMKETATAKNVETDVEEEFAPPFTTGELVDEDEELPVNE